MTKYNLKQDHEAIKKQIKIWEKDMDRLHKELSHKVLDMSSDGDFTSILNEIENISHEMMAINL